MVLLSHSTFGKDAVIHSLTEDDLTEADRICRLSFGTFLGLPDPMSFFGDADYVHTRFRADPSLTLGAYIDGQVIGSNFIANWGSVGIFGPLTVRPDLWDKGIAKKLLDGTMEIFARLKTRHIGLFTFANSTKHVHLYQKYDFWARFLTPVMSKAMISSRANGDVAVPSRYSKYSDNSEAKRVQLLDESFSLTDSIYVGLDLRSEIMSINKQKLGDTILLRGKDNSLCGLVVCHYGSGTEAGRDTCYVKFGAAIGTGDRSASENFDQLLKICEYIAALQGLTKLVAGVNIGNLRAYRKMMANGFRTDFQGVLMTRSNDPGYHREDIYVIDDWR